MTTNITGASIGARIQATRKSRGIRTTRELAELITGATVTESIIENLESGRKVNLDVSQLLNIAMALRVPPTYLLAPIGSPDAPIDLPNLSDAFDGMTAIQFDAWLSGLNSVTYVPRTMDERNARTELDVLREMTALTSEILRLKVCIDLERSALQSMGSFPPAKGSFPPMQSFQERLDLAESQRFRLREYLDSAGWALPEVASADLQDRSASA